MTQDLLSTGQKKRVAGVMRELGAQHHGGGSGCDLQRAAPESHTFRCRQAGSEQPLWFQTRETPARWSSETGKTGKVKMTVAAGGGGR